MLNEQHLKLSLGESYISTLRALLSVSTRSKRLATKTAVLIGSAMHATKPITTDVDLCFYIDRVVPSAVLLSDIMETFKGPRIDLLEKPTFLSDYHNQRIECTIRVNGLVFELTYLDGNLLAQTTPHLVPKDNYERHIGNLFAYGIVVHDEPDSRYQTMKQRFLPYYDETLRLTRLDALREFLSERLDTLSKLSNKMVEQTPILGTLLQAMLQYVYIRSKVYPYSYEKWIEKQFTQLLNNRQLYNKFSEAFLPGMSNTKRIPQLDSLISDIDKIGGANS